MYNVGRSALGLGRTKAYELAKRDQFRCRLLHIGSTCRIPTAELLRYIGVDPAVCHSR